MISELHYGLAQRFNDKWIEKWYEGGDVHNFCSFFSFSFPRNIKTSSKYTKSGLD